jgi:hypothetical protein
MKRQGKVGTVLKKKEFKKTFMPLEKVGIKPEQLDDYIYDRAIKQAI